MITIPFGALLFIYLFFMLGFVVFSFVNVGHLISTGTVNRTSLAVILLYFIFSIFITVATWILIGDVDWQQPLVVWSISWLTPIYSIGFAF